MASSTKSKSRQTPFKSAHLLEYGLVITQRNPKSFEVRSVRCQFCAFFGREQIIGQKRQRKQTENEKYWRPPFRPQYYRDRHEKQHHTRWQEYKRLSKVEKESYFTEKVRYKETIPGHFGTSQNSHPNVFKINLLIVETVIGDMFFHPDDHDGVTRTQALKSFTPCSDPNIHDDNSET